MLLDRTGKPRLPGRMALILALLLMMALACSTSDLPGGGSGEATATTGIDDAVQATIAALGGQPTPTQPPPPTADLQATVDFQLTTIALQNQAPPTLEPPTAEPPTVEPATAQPTSLPVSAGGVKLSEWNSADFRPDNSCSDPKQEIACLTGRGYEMTLESVDYILIDPGWRNPHLAFNHKYVFNSDTTIFIKRRSQGKWEVFRTFRAASTGMWVTEDLDLRDYLGEEIMLRFATGGSAAKNWWKDAPKNVWTLQDIRITSGK